MFFQDYDSKHTSRSTKAWVEQTGIINSVMKTPASSPDLNPIENVWAGMKTFLQCTAKPKTKQELVSGICSFWKTLTARHCVRYIDHVHRVIPQVIMNNGEATNFWSCVNVCHLLFVRPVAELLNYFITMIRNSIYQLVLYLNLLI